MMIKSPARLLRAVLSSASQLNIRAIILRGWAMLGTELLDADDPGDSELIDYAERSCLFVNSAAQDWLFPRCACAVIHGGAGTTAVALRSGVPVVVAPVFWDQAWFGSRVAELGIGSRVQHADRVSASELATAIEMLAESPEVRVEAARLSENIKKEEGSRSAAVAIDDFITGAQATIAARVAREQEWTPPEGL